MSAEDDTAVPRYADLLCRTDAPTGSSWGVPGPDPERGMAAFADAAQVRAAAACVLEGRTFGLDHLLDAFVPSLSRFRRETGHCLFDPSANQHDDYLEPFYLQSASHVDGLRHRSLDDGRFYGGRRIADLAAEAALGVHVWANTPTAGRGVLIDLEGPRLAAGTSIDHFGGEALPLEEILTALDRQRVVLAEGDIVILHTGWADSFLDQDHAGRAAVIARRRYTGIEQSRAFLAWAWDSRRAMIGSDTFALEVMPPVPDGPFAESAAEDHGMMHQELIAKLGLPVGELWRTGELAAHSRASGRWDCLITVKPLAVRGGVGAPANVVAIR